MSILPKLRYLRHLPPKMVWGKAAHAVRERLLRRFPPSPSRLENASGEFFQSDELAGFAANYRAAGQRFTEAAKIWDGEFSTKGVAWDFGSVEAMDWTFRFADRRELVNWNYDWCAFSHAIALVERDAERAAATLARLVQRMEQVHPLGSPLPTLVWEPIVVALRIMGISTAAHLAHRAGVDDRAAMLALARHVDYCHKVLLSLCEVYLGYNHAAFGISGILVADMALAREPTPFALKLAPEVFASQLLSDGFHAERSPTYHIHVLLLLRSLLAARVFPRPDAELMQHLENKMVAALAPLVHSDGEIAIFNDAAIGDSVPPAAVGCQLQLRPGKSVLPAAGYVCLRSARASLHMDAGLLGPPENCGHGHADFLAVEASLEGRRVIVDPGVLSTGKGELRQRTRSAHSHNGPTYQGLEPAEFFGAWRVGRRGSAQFENDSDLPGWMPWEALGSADGYAPFGGKVMRYVGLTQDSAVLIADAWTIVAGHEAMSTYLIAEDWRVQPVSAQRLDLVDQPSGEIRLCIELLAGTFGQVRNDLWAPQGPMQPRTGTRFSVAPLDGRFACLCLRALDAGRVDNLPALAAVRSALEERLAANSIFNKLAK